MTSCLLCTQGTITERFKRGAMRVVVCGDCGLQFLDPQPSDDALSAIYGEGYFVGSADGEEMAKTRRLKQATASLQLADIQRYAASRGDACPLGQAIEIGCGIGDFLKVATDAEIEIRGVDVSASAVASANAYLGRSLASVGTLEDLDDAAGSLDLIVLADVIEHVRDPVAFLGRVGDLLRPGGVVFAATPALDSWSARLMGRHWMDYKPEHLFYFDRRTVSQLFDRAGFDDVTITPGRKALSLDYVRGHFTRYPVPLVTPVLSAIHTLLPRTLADAPFRITASGINIVATKR